MPAPIDKPTPFSMRLTQEERARLEHDADGRSWSSYIRWKLFSTDAPPPPRKRGQYPVKDHQAIAAILALLGQSRIANNLNQIAKAIHSGSLIVTPDVATDIQEARLYLAEIRTLLIRASSLSDGTP